MYDLIVPQLMDSAKNTAKRHNEASWTGKGVMLNCEQKVM